jgi:hypothetical protein
MGTSNVPILAEFYLHAYGVDFLQRLPSIKIENKCKPLIPASVV